MVMPFDDGFSDYNAERLRAADTLLLGRTSYEGFRSYWPATAEDASKPAVEREISRLDAAIEKVVVSESLEARRGRGVGPDPRRPAHGRARAGRRTQREAGSGDPDVRQSPPLERPACQRLGGRAALHDRCRRGRRGRAGVRDPAARLAPPAGHPHLRRLEPAPSPVRRRALTEKPRPTPNKALHRTRRGLAVFHNLAAHRAPPCR